MARAPQTKVLKPDVLEGPDRDEKLLDGLNRFMGPTATALSGNLTLVENIRAQIHTSGVIAVPDDWVDLELHGDTSWSNGADQRARPAARRTPDGRVYLRGSLTTPTGTAGSFILGKVPSGYEPAYRSVFPVSATAAFGVVTVMPTGNVLASVGTLTGNVLLDPIAYDAASRDPVPAACWPYAFDYPLGTTRPRSVETVEVREVDNNRPVNVPNPDWDFITVNGKPKVQIRNMAGLTPGRRYRCTWRVLP